MASDGSDSQHPEYATVVFIYNRPGYVARLLKALEVSKPSRLYVIADGPKSASDAIACNDARSQFESIPWKCELLTNYSDQNLGLLDRITSGIDWVFQFEDAAIFLEDDCIPSPSFLPFASQCLQRYESDMRIGMISGNSFQLMRFEMPESYTFASLPRIWGWATWRSRWEKNRDTLAEWRSSPEKLALLRSRFPSITQRRHWLDQLESTSSETNWDYQWVARHFLEGWLSIAPAVNLVSNIGVGGDATHTKSENVLMGLPSGSLRLPLTHPSEVRRNRRWDRSELWSLRFARIFGKSRAVSQIIHNQLRKDQGLITGG